MMKTLILNGGPRKKGVTSRLLDCFAETLATKSKVESFFIYSESIRPCIGCLKCRPDKTCVLPHDAAHDIAQKIDKADLLIIGFPTYWGNMPGPLKTLFDRCVPTFEYIEGFNIKKMQKGKRAILVTASSAPIIYNQLPSQSRGAIRSVKTVLKSGGIKIIKTINVPHASKFPEKQDKYFRKISKNTENWI